MSDNEEPIGPPEGDRPDDGAARAALAVKRVGLFTGAALFAALLLLPAPGGMSAAAWSTTAAAVLMACWWITEAIPIPATALLPLVLFPLLGIAPVGQAATPYANPVIFLFLGGFMLAAGLERCGLHRRLALSILRLVGTRPPNLVGGFMIATAAISLWVSNTATVLMMLPIATSVVALSERDGTRAGSKFPVALLLGVAYAASIGGLGTLIGTPPNALLAGFTAETLGRRIGFVEWMLVGVPLVAVAIPLCWLLLVRVIFRLERDEIAGGREMIEQERASLGPLSRSERIVSIVGGAMALAWVFEPLLERALSAVSDAGIAMTGGLLLLLVPVEWRQHRGVIDWSDIEKLPWGVLILFGGGLSLAAAIESTGLARWIGESMAALGVVSPFWIALVVTTIVIFLTELTSNTATAATFLPLVASLAGGLGLDPMLLVVPATLAASCGFMLPAGTPPNALVYASGHMTIPQMARAGIAIDVLMIALIMIALYALAVPVFGIG